MFPNMPVLFLPLTHSLSSDASGKNNEEFLAQCHSFSWKDVHLLGWSSTPYFSFYSERGLRLCSGKSLLNWSWVLRSPLLLCPWATFPFSTSKADIWFSSAQLPQLTSQVFQNSGTEQGTVYWTPSNPNIWLNRKRFLLLDSILENRLLKISRITFSTHTALLIMDKFTLKAKKKRLCNKNTKSTWQNSTSGHDFALE